ncbi:hypothetical protein H4Q26_000304 [Puccinia striiformis f. sp. tritici PST-130]|nr:hypothetical protein H4Q26_000304 [Puccinia striiformis f. sp. tritici PST-130]
MESLVIQAFERFLKIDQGHEEGGERFVDEQTMKPSFSPFFLEPTKERKEEISQIVQVIRHLVSIVVQSKGINKRTLGRQVEDFLISPIYEWINQTTSHDDGNTDSNRKRISTQNGGPSLDVKSLVHCSIKILRDLCIEIFNQAKAAFQAALYDYNVSEQKRTFTIRVRLTQDRKPTRQSARGTVMNYGSRLGTALNEQSTESVSFNINEPLVP